MRGPATRLNPPCLGPRQTISPPSFRSTSRFVLLLTSHSLTSPSFHSLQTPHKTSLAKSIIVFERYQYHRLFEYTQARRIHPHSLSPVPEKQLSQRKAKAQHSSKQYARTSIVEAYHSLTNIYLSIRSQISSHLHRYIDPSRRRFYDTWHRTKYLIEMQLPTISTLLLLPLLAVAQSSSSTTTLTSTATLTRTITVSQVVASVTSTYPAYNSTTTAGPTAAGNGAGTTSASSSSTAKASSTIPANFMGAASSLNSMYAGSAGIVVMIAAALL